MAARYVGSGGADELRSVVAGLCRMPSGLVDVHLVDDIPRLPNGKPDLCALAGPAASDPVPQPDPSPSAPGSAAQPWAGSVTALYARLLDRPDACPDDSFVALGGDSLSYVEMSVQLESLLGSLPDDWHVQPAASLEARQGSSRSRLWSRLDLTVLLRAVAIVLVVGSHANVFMVMGGAHVLLGVAGYNVARFTLALPERRERVRHLAGSVGRIVVPSVAWIALVTVLAAGYGWPNLLLSNWWLGPDRWTDAWQFWYVEALVLILVATLALVAVPRLNVWERREPFLVAVAVVAGALALRFELIPLGSGSDRIHSPAYVAFAFAVGWAAAQAKTFAQRLVVSALVLVSVPGFFVDDRQRDLVVVGGLLLLVWVQQVWVPRSLVRLLGALAGASLWIYLTHWQVYPYLEFRLPLAALGLSLLVGVAMWALAQRVGGCARLLSEPTPNLEGWQRQRTWRNAAGGLTGRASRTTSSAASDAASATRRTSSTPMGRSGALS